MRRIFTRVTFATFLLAGTTGTVSLVAQTVDRDRPTEAPAYNYFSTDESDDGDEADRATESASPPAEFASETNLALEATGDGCCDCCGGIGCGGRCCFDWSQIPGSHRLFPRPGNWFMPPTGCGYYTGLDQWRGTLREKPRPSGYLPSAAMPPSFFDSNFRYVDNLPCDERTLVERLKRIQLNDCWMFGTGGQVRLRYMNEHNSRLLAANNSYFQARTIVYGDLHYGDRLRFYGDFLWADSFSEELVALGTDANRGDTNNLFVDVNFGDWDGHSVYGRFGRQELLFGSQRLVSSLDWANTRRKFEGVRLFRQGDQWDFDAFYTQFVPNDAGSFDQHDDNQDLGGAWLTYRPQAGTTLDMYYLYHNNTNSVTQLAIPRYPAEIHSFGSRYAGDDDGRLWDYEAILQCGRQNFEDLFAGAVTVGRGRNFKDACWSPTVWVYYDYASGDADPTTGRATTFNHLYPFGHYYLGWADQVARQNVHDVHAHLYLYPQHWIMVWMQYHHFWLNHSQDALYNFQGVAIRRDPTGAAGNNVGDELDLVLNFHLTRYADLMAGYSHFYGAGFVENTPGADDVDFFFLTYSQRW